MEKYRVGIIGTGFIGVGKHLEGLARNQDLAEVVAFCDLIPERAEAARARFGGEASYVTTDWKQVLADDSIDVVYVCTPNVSHAEISCAALEAGKHVMCEKPMAITGADAREMVSTAKRTGKKLTVGYQYRLRQDAQFLRRLVDDGELGEIYVAKAHAVRRRGVPTWGVFTDKSKQGGGPLIDIGTHALDLALWYMGDYEVESVTGSVFHKLGDKPEGNIGGPWDPETFEVEDSAFGYITMKSGSTIFLESSWALNVKESRETCVTLMGTEGGADIEQHGLDFDVSLNQIVGGRMTLTRQSTNAFFGDSAAEEGGFVGMGTAETRQWLESIRDDTDPLVLPEQACRVTEILEAIYASAASGRAVRF